MLIALFGGTGFIGKHLVTVLLAEGYRIRLALTVYKQRLCS